MVDEHCEQFEAMFDLVLDVIERGLEARRVIAPAKGVRRSLGPDHRIALTFAEQLIAMVTAGRPIPNRADGATGIGFGGLGAIRRFIEIIEREIPYVWKTPRPLSPWSSIEGYDKQTLPILVATGKDRMEVLLRRGIATMRGGMLAQRVPAPVARLREAVDAGPD